MAYSDQLYRKRSQYIAAYNQASNTADNLSQVIKTVGKMMGNTGQCYYVNDTDIGRNHLQSEYDALVRMYNFIVQTVLPQTKSIINNYTNAYRDQLRKENEKR